MPPRLRFAARREFRVPLPFRHKEQTALARSLAKWTAWGLWVGLLSGTASAVFLRSLDWATTTRESRPYLLWLLPFAGVVIALAYGGYGKAVEGGNNLLLERVHQPNDRIPFRMVPLILLSTIMTHLFGGSAGREGTAVQMGGTLANLAQKPLRLSAYDHRLLIMAGISGGFGSVFGTPLAGTVFGLEVLTVGRLSYEGLIPCFVASCVGDLVTRGLGVHHAAYPAGDLPVLTPWLWLLIVLAGALFGLVGLAFGELTHAVSHLSARWLKQAWLRPFAGGCLLIALTYAVGTRDYLGLSLPLIARSFTPGGVFALAFALKIVFTALTLGTGFKGGEVTPLFCIGATLGATLARLTGQPPAFFAALGFVAVFAGAANTPLTCIVLGMELFGARFAVPLGAACIISYTLSGHRGIYLSQQIGVSKSQTITIVQGVTLRDARSGSSEIKAAPLPNVSDVTREPGKRHDLM